ncbi:MAG: Mur ligase family protein, partial [Patescibacteria group bacterium]
MKHIFKKIIAKILELEAQAVLWKYKPKIVAVTGNVGKTSTKDAIYTVLSKALFVRKSQKSFNSDIGVPLTIIGCPNAWINPFLWLKNIIFGLEIIL